jgi:hypothetical protein
VLAIKAVVEAEAETEEADRKVTYASIEIT